MKQILPVTFAAITLGLLAGCNERGGDQNITLSQEPANPTPTLSVSGDAFVEATPDEAGFTVDLLSRAETAQAASSQMNANAKKLIDALKGAGVKEADIQTGWVNVRPEYEPHQARVVHSLNDEPKPRAIVGYNATYSLSLTFPPLDKVGDLSKLIQKADGFANLNGPDFSISDASPYEGEALEKAYADALAKAEKLAAKAGMKITGPRSINGNASGGGPMPTTMRFRTAGMEGAPNESMPVAAGVQRINANVGVTFNIEPAK